MYFSFRISGRVDVLYFGGVGGFSFLISGRVDELFIPDFSIG